MRVLSLDLAGWRNLRPQRIEAAPRLNMLLGANAAGKTSVLEALYVLGRGRSFRARQPKELIQIGENSLRIVAKLRESDGQDITLGMERTAHQLTLRVGGAPTRSLAALARYIPVLLLNADSHALLSGGAQLRRRFMDWGLFHSEPGFLDAWRRYESALRNRNAALRSAAFSRMVDAWDQELATAAQLLDPWRAAFCTALEATLERLVQTTLGTALGMVRIIYRRGWPQEPLERGFVEWLRSGREQDRQLGYTRIGPHRADFMLRLANQHSAIALSRGQQKLLIIALILAQAELYKTQVGNACILLIDDLPAELDPENRQRVMGTLASLDAQLFVTAIESDILDITAWKEARTFYLADGIIS